MNYLFALTAIAAAVVNAQTLSVRSAVLVIGSSGSFSWGAGLSVVNTLNGYGIKYDTIEVPNTGYAGSLNLEKSATQGSYSVIVFPDGMIQYYNATIGTYQQALTSTQMSQIQAYEAKYKVRRVQFNTWPDPNAHGAIAIDSCCGSGIEDMLSLNSTTLNTFSSGIKPTATLSSMNLWHYSTQIVDYKIAQPLLSTSKGPISVITKQANGLQQMVFFISLDGSVTGNMMNHLWISWATRSIYAGHRRIYLTPQVDDIFLSTSTWDDSVQAGTLANSFRITAQDLIIHENWQNSLESRLPEGSSIKICLAFNGNGLLAFTNTNPVKLGQTSDAPWGFVKPAGTGNDFWTAINYPLNPNWNVTQLQTDSLFQYASNATLASNFNWVSHTFTHLTLNNVTKSDADKEVYYNQMMTDILKMTNASYFSKNSIVTGGITGLFNGDALSAFAARGIVNVVGDNSHPELTNPTNIHWPVTSTSAANGYNGATIVPRNPTEVYFQASNVSQNLDMYNYIYASKIGNTTDYNVVLARETNRVLKMMLGLRKDGHMFHQANMRAADQVTETINGFTGQFSLIMRWIESVTAAYSNLVNWPIVSKKQQDLAQIYLERQQRDQCNAELFVNFDSATGIVLSAQLNTQNACKVPVSSQMSFNNYPADSTIERLSSADPTTYWVNAKANSSYTFGYSFLWS